MAEKTLIKNKGDLPVVLFRPSIIASSMEQPFPGWTDSLAAAGGITLMGGMGLIPYINAGGQNLFDMVPADIVSNGILVSTCKQGIDRSPKLDIYNMGTSEKNPITMGQYKDMTISCFQFFKFNKGPFRA
jgi:fatty acyl-CoA reductase